MADKLRRDGPLWAVLALLSYVPVFLSRPGQVIADTKEYLYLDPAKLTTSAASLWDPNTGMGTVTHQNIGYLLPMGPYYSAVQWLGIPMWVGQRIWMGSLMLLAGLGVAYCARRLSLEGYGRVVAAIAYTLSPYILDYLDRISAILMPWSALGWMVGLTVTAARTGRWRHPALFALVVALVGGVNATSILLVLAAPSVWLVYAVWVTGEITLRRALATSARLALLSTLVSLWWAAGLWAEGRYGINILRVTETVPTVSRTSSAAEVLRGLGYWYFYGWDKVQPWTLQAPPYTQDTWLIGLSLGLPGLGILLGFLTRWAYRGLCLAWVAVGTVVAVGAFPFSDPSAFGALIKGASAGSELALAMRSVDRIVPIVVLGLALLMGSGVTALRLRAPAVGLVAASVCLALVGANLPALWDGTLLASNLSRPSQLPSYWTQAAAYLNSQGASSRVLGLPGEDFAAYSFGETEDPIPPGLLDRPYVARQVVPSGTPASANLLQALDEPIQEGTVYTPALVPVARLMSVGQILLQSDLQYERYHLPLPKVLYAQLTSDQAGLGTPTNFGGPDPAPQIRYPLDSEARLGIPAGTPQPAALSVFNVSDPRALVRTEAPSDPIVVAGDGAGVVEAAGAGLLGGDQPIVYAATGASDPGLLSQALGTGSTLVLTDTNPDANYTWGSLSANIGQVEQPGVADPSTTPSDYALPVFPDETTADQTVAVVSGVKSVTANQYGDSLSFTPEDRPINAFDGNPSTVWAFGAHEAVNGIRLDARLDHPVTTDHLTLHQLADLGRIKRHITSVTLLFDGKDPVTVPLTKASQSATGQTVHFSARTFSDFQLIVNGATDGADKKYDGLPAVGFTEISIPGVLATESLLLPTALLSRAGASSLAHPLDILMQRLRVSGPPRSDPEPFLSRTFQLPTGRTFDLSGTAEINYNDSDDLINRMIGLTPTGSLPAPAGPSSPGPATVVAANSSTRLVGDRQARANAAVDGNRSTAWIAETGPHQAGEWISFDLSKPITFDRLDLQVLNDGRHSLPSRITISTASGSRTVDVPVPPVGAGRPQDATTTVPLSFPALSGATVKVTIDAVHQVRALDYYATFTGATDVLPVGIAELGLPGVVQPPAPATVPAVCTGKLLRIDGKAVDLEVTGSTADALSGEQLTVHLCGNSRSGIHLGPGTHTVVTSGRLATGWSLDQLWFSSGAGGAAAPLDSSTTGTGASTGSGPTTASTATGTLAAATGPTTPPVTVDGQNRTSLTVSVRADGKPFWLVLGQSYSAGWTASIDGGPHLGAPQLIDAFANGWLVPSLPAGKMLVIHLDWTPQEVVWAALAVSAAAMFGSVVLAVLPEGMVWFGRRGRGGRDRRAGRRLADLRFPQWWRRRSPDRQGHPAQRPAGPVLAGPVLAGSVLAGPVPAGPEPASLRAFLALPPAGSPPGSSLPTGFGRPSWSRAAATAVAWGLVTALVSRPVTGGLVAVAAFAATRWRFGRAACRLGAIGALVVLPVYDVVQQRWHHYWPEIGWPANMSSANDIAWLALGLVGADLVAGWSRWRTSRLVYARPDMEGSP